MVMRDYANPLKIEFGSGTPYLDYGAIRFEPDGGTLFVGIPDSPTHLYAEIHEPDGEGDWWAVVRERPHLRAEIWIGRPVNG